MPVSLCPLRSRYHLTLCLSLVSLVLLLPFSAPVGAKSPTPKSKGNPGADWFAAPQGDQEDSPYQPYYWEKPDYSLKDRSGAVKAMGLSQRKILQMGLDRFCEFHNARFEKREGYPPRLALGDEQAELIYLWVQRQENLRGMARLPQLDRRRIQEIEVILSKMEHCEVQMRRELTSGGTAWLGFMRAVGLRHEALVAQLIRASGRTSTGADATTKAQFRRSLDGLKQAIARDEKRLRGSNPQNTEDAGTPVYRKSLAAFKLQIAHFEKLTIPPGMLNLLADYLPDCWWERMNERDR